MESTDEFLNIVRSTESRGLLASLDVESLFTNVPVDTTIDIILQYAYDHPSIEPPTIPKNRMKTAAHSLHDTCAFETHRW